MGTEYPATATPGALGRDIRLPRTTAEYLWRAMGPDPVPASMYEHAYWAKHEWIKGEENRGARPAVLVNGRSSRRFSS